MKKLEIHPFALIFPKADREDRENLRNDILKNGVKVPIVLFEGKILDGRSRYDIARLLGKAFPTTEFRGTAKNALELAVSYNLYRRHLSQSQKAAVAVDIQRQLMDLDGIEEEEAQETASKATGAAKSTMKRYERIQESAPRVAEEIRKGEKTVGEVLGRSKTKCPFCKREW